MEKVPMTEGSYQKLDEEIKLLKGPERQRIIKAIAEAREHGDLSENAEYEAAKDKQGFIEGRIQELESKFAEDFNQNTFDEINRLKKEQNIN